MYDWPEERSNVDTLWSRLRARSGLNLPRNLERVGTEDALFSIWRDPTLLVGQTCWGPLTLGMLPRLRVLAQPDYSDVPGGRNPFYRSVLVAREGTRMPTPVSVVASLPTDLDSFGCLAVNAHHSMSGWLALAADVGLSLSQATTREGAFSTTIVTGSHRASIRAVAAGRADLAAIDCRTWSLAQQHEPCAQDLVVVGWTAERPGLPFVTGAGTDDGTAERLRETLIGMGCHPPQERD